MVFNKPVWLLMVLVVFGGGLVFSETVSIIIVETGIREESPRIESSGLWENGLMDVFFENGHIVSNAPILRLNAGAANPYPGEQLLNLNEVKAGGANFYVLAVLSYSETNEKTSGPLTPRLISLRFVRLSPYKVLYEVQLNGTQGKIQDELDHAKKAAQAMIPYFKDKVSRHFPGMTGFRFIRVGKVNNQTLFKCQA